MNAKWVSILFGILLILASATTVFADKPTPEATPHGKSGKTPPGLVSQTPDANETPEADDKSEKEGKGQAHGAFGTVTGVGTGSFTISTKQGPLTVLVTTSTKFHIPHDKQASVADISVGDRVAVNGTPGTGGLSAKQVHVAPGKPTIRHRVGKVTAYIAGSSITIQAEDGTSETFSLTADTKIKNPKGSGVAVGDQVTIVSRRDPANNTATATGIVVHPNGEKE